MSPSLRSIFGCSEIKVPGGSFRLNSLVYGNRLSGHMTSSSRRTAGSHPDFRGGVPFREKMHRVSNWSARFEWPSKELLSYEARPRRPNTHRRPYAQLDCRMERPEQGRPWAAQTHLAGTSVAPAA